uniref:Uncharacterized protein n=1 Tax=Alexandrium catenella TaxID=2925 RepID=A0A7S1LP14_ALECA
MGAGASAGVSAVVAHASADELRDLAAALSPDHLARLREAVACSKPEAREEKFREPPVRDVNENCNGVNCTPSMVLFMEGASEAERAEMKAALAAYAATVYQEDTPPHRQDMLFFYASGPPASGGCDMRHFAKDLTTHPLLVVFNLDDDAPYFVKTGGAGPIDKSAMERLVADFAAKRGAEPIGAQPDSGDESEAAEKTEGAAEAVAK